eukprot:gene23202-27824_t
MARRVAGSVPGVGSREQPCQRSTDVWRSAPDDQRPCRRR